MLIFKYYIMKLNKCLPFLTIITLFILVSACQKLDRPALDLILDPPPPAYNALKSFWGFENNVTDEGENKFKGTGVNVSYGAGINGQALKVGPDGYLLLKGTDTVKYPNGFVAVPIDTLKSLGSLTVAFWMNGVGPVTGGAQGLFAISNKNEFWGNLELFLDNDNTTNEAYLKVHMFNASVASGNGEEWNEIKIPNGLNKWTHIAVTYDAGTSKLNVYADGVAVIPNKTLGGGNYGTLKFKDVGGMVLGTMAFQTTPSLTNHGPEPWAKSFNGSLDQFRLYNKALSTTEISDLFNSKK